MPIATPISVSTMRANAYSGLDDPSASTSIAEIATWLPVPGEARKIHATSIATTIASSTIQLGEPNSSPSPTAITTPAITPMLRSSAFDSDWFTLGCTTSSAAIAAKTGSCAGNTHPAISHAAIVAAADFTTCSSGERWEARIAVGMRMPSTVVVTSCARGSCVAGRCGVTLCLTNSR